MSDRLLTLGFALGALLAFFYFFIGPTVRPGEQGSRPLSSESRPNGYLGARLWLESQQVPVQSLRHRFDSLAGDGELPKQGNLLITTIPFQRPMRRGEMTALRDWILRGNSVLVAAGLFDTPEWAVPEIDTFGDLRDVTGLEFRNITPAPPPEEKPTEPVDPDAVAEFKPLPYPQHGVLRPNGRHPLTAGVDVVFAESEYAADKFAAVTPAGSPLLSLMRDNESGFGALWLTPLGKGTVVVSGYGSIFTNKLLDQADNARLLGNVVGQMVGPGGHVMFDDVHQGAADFYDAEAFFADSRLHASFWWIIGLWLIWVLGGTRLPPPATAPGPVREQAFMAANGNFFARVIDRKRIARRMMANFFNEFRRSLGLPVDGRPLWPWMRGIATLEPGLLERVEALHVRVAAGKRVSLIELHNRLQQMRKQLQ
jgi:hypothetical protein